MDLRDQLVLQRKLAVFTLRESGMCTTLDLVLVLYPLQPEIPPRISIIGHAISWGSVDVWNSQGALSIWLETVSKETP